MVTETTLMAYGILPVKKCEHIRSRIMDILRKEGPLTDRELATHFTVMENVELQPKARRNELVKMGKVYESVQRQCTVSGHLAKTWGVYDVDDI